MGEIADALRRSGTGQPTRPPEPSPPAPRQEREPILPDPPPSNPPVIESSPPTRRVLHIRRTDAVDAQAAPARSSACDPHGAASQQFLRVAFRLRDLAIERGISSIVLTSSEPFEGKTTTACNLATSLAKLDQTARVVLLDLDLHRASVASSLGIEIEIPVDAVLRGERTLDEAVMETDVEGLSILGLNRPAAQADALLAHPRFRALLSDLTSRFDFIIIDTPPVLTVPDAQVVLRHADAGLIVTRAGMTSVRALRRTLEYLPGDKVLGTILNCSKRDSGLNRGGYYDYADELIDTAEGNSDVQH
jgi:tyrosine-protein kinase